MNIGISRAKWTRYGERSSIGLTLIQVGTGIRGGSKINGRRTEVHRPLKCGMRQGDCESAFTTDKSEAAHRE